MLCLSHKPPLQQALLPLLSLTAGGQRTVAFTWSSGPLELPVPRPSLPGELPDALRALSKQGTCHLRAGTGRVPACSDPLAQRPLDLLRSAGDNNCSPPECSRVTVECPQQLAKWIIFNLICSLHSTVSLPPPPLKLAWFLRLDW